MQRRTAVTVYLKNKQLLLFAFANVRVILYGVKTSIVTD